MERSETEGAGGGVAPAEAFLSTREAAALLRVDVKTVHRAIAAGQLPHVRLGRVIRLRRDTVLSLGKVA